METGKRKFSARRLYKLIRLLVIVIAILSGILACACYRASKHYKAMLPGLDKEYSNLITQFPKLSDREYFRLTMKGVEKTLTEEEKKLLEHHRKVENIKNEREHIVSEMSDRMSDFLMFSAIAIGLPILFFGGTGIYRYLFPIQKESK